MLRFLRPIGQERGRFLRFIATGALNTVFGYVMFLCGILNGLAPVTALAAATVICAVFNFLTVSRLVFGEQSMLKIPIFTVAYVIVFILNGVTLHILTMAGVRPWLAQIFALPPVVSVNFGLMRLWVFRRGLAE